MDKDANEALFRQVRVAHRLLASYYKRVHQLISDVSGDDRLGLKFFVWGPTEYSRPCRRTTQVLGRCSWELLPGVLPEYLFLHGPEGKPQQPGEWLLAMHVISDTVVFDEEKGEDIDAVEIQVSADDAHSVLRCYLIAPHKELDLYWADDIWKGVEYYPDCTERPERQCVNEGDQIYASAFEMPLETLTGKDSVETLVQKIVAYRDVVLPQAVRNLKEVNNG